MFCFLFSQIEITEAIFALSIFGINPDTKRGEVSKSAEQAPTLFKLTVHGKGRLNIEKFKTTLKLCNRESDNIIFSTLNVI